MTDPNALAVEFCGEAYKADPTEILTFGREADITLDENQYMHRVVGRFEARHDRWWLINLGNNLAIEVYDHRTKSRITLMPKADCALPQGATVVRFSAGSCLYELDTFLDFPDTPEIEQAEPSDTLTVKKMTMTESQLLLLVALAEHKLRQPQAKLYVPPSKEAAARLGWKITKFNRKLDNVSDKFAKAGVTGLKASGSNPARDRRRRLVEHAVLSGLVEPAMLDLLEKPGGSSVLS